MTAVPRMAFAKAALKQAGQSSMALLDAIFHERPDLKGQMHFAPKHGGVAHTLIIGDEVFKGPKFETACSLLEQEYMPLQQLNSAGVAGVPAVTCVGKETFFFGMTRMKGVEVADLFSGLSATQVTSFAKDFAGFIADMAQAFPKQVNLHSAVPHHDNIMGSFSTKLIADVLGDDLEFCRREIGDFYKRTMGRQLVMMHGDLHGHNILMDETSKKMTAVIDFGYTKYGYIERDLASTALLRDFGRSFVAEVWSEFAKMSKGVDMRDYYCHPLCSRLRAVVLNTSSDRIADVQETVQQLKSVFDSGKPAIAKPAPIMKR